MVGGGCSLLRLSTKVDQIKENLDNEEQKVLLYFILLFKTKNYCDGDSILSYRS